MRRLSAPFAFAVASALAACGNNSTVVSSSAAPTPAPIQSNLRFVNGAPDLGSVDFYFEATGVTASAPAGTSTTDVAYAVVTPFVAESPGAGTVVVRAAGSSASSAPLDNLSCPIPQMVLNQTYTVVVSGIGSGNHRCVLFQDIVYTTTPEYRVHDAALGAPSSVAYGTYSAGTTAGSQVPYNGAQVAMLGGVDGATSSTVATPASSASRAQGASSSRERSGTMAPETPAAASDRARRWCPARKTRL